MNWIFKILILLAFGPSCKDAGSTSQVHPHSVEEGRITPAAERTGLYMPLLQSKNLGLIVNQTSRVGASHLVDYLIEKEIDIKTIFSPEHGFRGKADAGEKLKDQIDPKTQLPIISLYGKNKKPNISDLKNLELLLFDIQDVGVRFYTYISTLHYVMEAAAENGLPLIVLDRPNPLGSFVDGPILEKEFESFVGMHPVPIVYGMTIGEYAQMINGEGWLEGGLKCDLKVIPLENYQHSDQYILPVKPSPNLPNNIAIGHYPSLCFFEGTSVSVGRGTDMQFQVIGHPEYPSDSFTFTPKSGPGSKYPKHENKECKGVDLRKLKPCTERLTLSHLIDMYQECEANEITFFNDDNFFNLLAGTDQLKQQLMGKISEEEIRASWVAGLLEFEMKRKKYLLYD